MLPLFTSRSEMRRSASLVVALALCAACGRDVAPAASPSAPASLVLADSVDHIDALAREPMVVRHPSGALFVTGYWDSLPPVWKSVDRGATWSRVVVGANADGAAGNSDSDLAVAPDGTLYLATLVFDRKLLTGASVQVAVSRDVGATWKWTELSRTPGDDRPWVEVADDGVAHVIWNDGAGVSHALSIDSGRSWKEGDRVNPQGGSNHLAVSPNGELAVRIIPPSAANNQYHAGVDLVAFSDDRGATWQRHKGPGEMQFPLMWDTTVTPRRFNLGAQPHWVEPLAWDSTGALYSLWAKEHDVWLGRSRDHGATWQSWKIATSDSIPYYPYLVARGRGELAASWFVGHGTLMRARVARLDVKPDSSPPTVILAPFFQPESFFLPGFGPANERESAGEYLPIVFLPDSSLGVIAPIQNPAVKRLGFSWRRYVVKR
jgi:hypothetical protein